MVKTDDLRIVVALAAAILAASFVVLVGPLTNGAHAQTAPPPGLGGELFAITDPADTTVSGSCDQQSGGTLAFEASGVATGPYPGTFTETGTVTLAPLNLTNFQQPVLAATADFAIDSPNGQVTGTKRFVVGSTGNGGCRELFDGSLRASAFTQNLRYTATIVTPDGRTCTTEGSTSLNFVENSSVLNDYFSESFLNDVDPFVPPTCEGGEEPPPPPPAVPTSKEQCKNAGFEDFAALGFKNQGECVAFVERGPKKEK